MVKARDSFLQAKLVEGLRTHTLVSYRSTINAFIRYASTTNGTASILECVRGFLETLLESNRKPSSVEQYRICLSVWLHWLYNEGKLPEDFAKRLPRIRTDRRYPRCLSPDEYERFQRAVAAATWSTTLTRTRNPAMLGMLWDTGLRVSELIGLTLADVSLSTRTATVRVSKGRTMREVKFTQDTATRLRAYLKVRGYAEGPLWLINGRLPATVTTVRTVVTTVARLAGIDGVHPHTLRHTAATRWIEAGMPIRSVQRLLGHARIETTQLYCHESEHTALEDYDRYIK